MTVEVSSRLDIPAADFSSFVRQEDKRLLTKGGTYVADLEFEDTYHVHFLRSYVANGIIKSIDVSTAKKMTGVIDVFTSADVDLDPIIPAKIVDQAMVRELLPSRRLRYVGEPMAVIVAKSKSEAEKAAEAIEVEIDKLKPVVDPIEALHTDYLLFEGSQSNIAST